jgi:hypothetical protein
MHRSTPYGVESRRIATVSSQGQQMGLTRGLTRVADKGSVNRAFVDNTTSSELTILQAPPVVCALYEVVHQKCLKCATVSDP